LKLKLLVLLGDLIFVPLSYAAAYFIRLQFGPLESFQEIVPFSFLGIIPFIYLAVFYFFDLYELRKNVFSFHVFANLCISLICAAVIVSFLKYGLFLQPIGRGILFLANFLILIFAFGWRNLCQQLLKKFITPKRVVILGAGKDRLNIAKEIATRHKDEFQIVGFLDEEENPGLASEEAEGAPFLGRLNNIKDLIHNHKIDQIIVAEALTYNSVLTKELLEAKLKGVEVIDLPEAYLFYKGKIPIDHVKDQWFLKTKGFGLAARKNTLRFKRLVDVTFSTFFFVVSLPLWPLIALSIKLNSKGPVFIKQKRVGKNEQIFHLIKFRSMIDKAEKGKPVWADENDSRVTFIGKYLRQFHLDELPQLINVMKGEMSLVGPRPERPEFVEELKRHISYYSLRHFVSPGLTGWAQVNIAYASSLEASREKLEYDLYYIAHMNLFLDLWIMMKTVRKILPKVRGIGRD